MVITLAVEHSSRFRIADQIKLAFLPNKVKCAQKLLLDAYRITFYSDCHLTSGGDIDPAARIRLPER